MSSPPAVMQLSLDTPLIAQGLDSAARKRIVSGANELKEMERIWKDLLQNKMEEIKQREELELFRKHQRECFRAKKAGTEPPKHRACDRLKYFFDPSSCLSIVKKTDFARQCLDEIRADARKSGENLPWPECIPCGIRHTMPLKEYIEAWVAEDDARALLNRNAPCP